MAARIVSIDPAAVARRLEHARERIGAAAREAGRDPEEVEILVASKYVAAAQMPLLAEAGVRLLGESRAQDLQEKVRACGGLFAAWDFIGALQSRKVRTILPYVRCIHSLASESACREMERHRELAEPGLEVLVQVNVAGEQGKSGVRPERIDRLRELCPFPVTGLSAMPPATADPEHSRRWFAQVRELAAQRGLRRLSMGTSQDYLVAVQEGASTVRLGRGLLVGEEDGKA